MSVNLRFAHQLLQQLLDQGVRTFCLCPGARNAPFVALLSDNPQLETLSFYDERSASFFALGRARQTQSPVVVITTSGTAVSEMLSATIEAWHVKAPLILLTADRPRTYRGTGAPQTIRQDQIFSGFVHRSFDLECGEPLPDFDSHQGPLHLNVCFDEPLLDGPLSALKPLQIKSQFESSLGRHELASDRKSAVADQLSLPPVGWLESLADLQSPLILVGGLPREARSAVRNWLSQQPVPYAVETLSGLAGLVSSDSRALHSGDAGLCRFLKEGRFKSLLRIGDVPVGRVWRDLEQARIPVLHLSDKPFPGLTHGQLWTTALQGFDWSQLKLSAWPTETLLQADRQMRQDFLRELSLEKNSELAFFAELATKIPMEAAVYLGNSLPVREWESIASAHAQVFASRGVNGIDGQLSTALGLLNSEHRELWIILGDLTTLYDFSGFWLTPWLREKGYSVRLVVVNNQGGQIFAKMFSQTLFLNRHNLNFRPLAEMWGWEYHAWERTGVFPELREGLSLIEMKVASIQKKSPSGHLEFGGPA